MHGRIHPFPSSNHPTIHATHEGILAKRRVRGIQTCFENGYPRVHGTRGRILGNGGLPFCPSVTLGRGLVGVAHIVPMYCPCIFPPSFPHKSTGAVQRGGVASEADGMVFWPDPCAGPSRVCLSVHRD